MLKHISWSYLLLLTVGYFLLSLSSCYLLLILSFWLLSNKDHLEGSPKISPHSAHIIVVTLFFGSCIFIYAWPISSFASNKTQAAFYTVITPLLSPIIYTMRRQKMQEAMRKLLFQHIRVTWNFQILHYVINATFIKLWQNWLNKLCFMFLYYNYNPCRKKLTLITLNSQLRHYDISNKNNLRCAAMQTYEHFPLLLSSYFDG